MEEKDRELYRQLESEWDGKTKLLYIIFGTISLIVILSAPFIALMIK